ncbi:cas scaffolding family member 4 isoform X2 [Pelobates cultripes]|uniref:Cas scaffolding protein family member 4 n=1 Tax=Pelobates cultripes TaxID=61616 RepID=A0AAD1SK30_PELCU|nr:cas scaffolding family member 4 isoform X2 [Pelobates cultripes]
MMKNNMLAKALYDNKAECSDELAFRKGDILTVLEQNVFGSEGWWRCYLHGRQGLAPANRLQVFSTTQNEILFTPTHYGSLKRQPSPQNIYQVPTTPKTENVSMYEPMDRIHITPPSPSLGSGEIYQTPVSPLVLYDKASSSTSQHLFTLPRASKASNPTSISKEELYDTPPSKFCTTGSPQYCKTPSPVDRRSPVFSSTEQMQQQIYDIPSSPDTLGRLSSKNPRTANIYTVPPSSLLHMKNGNEPLSVGPNYNTLPNPRKSEWIYDIPVSPEKKNQKASGYVISTDSQIIYDVPPTRYGFEAPVKVDNSSGIGQIYDILPNHKKSASADQTLYDVPASRDSLPVQQNGGFNKLSSSFGRLLLEKVDAKENVYDIPRGLSTPLHEKRKMSSPFPDKCIYDVPPTLPRNFKLSSSRVEHDRASISSSESRTSTLSTSSTASCESFTSSSSEESTKEVILEHEASIKKITQLQERVSTSIASLMIFVSSKWRLQEHMEANLEEIHRAADNITLSLGLFVDFAHCIRANASQLTDSNIQLRIIQQLSTLTDSLKTLLCHQEAINLCNWSLQKLVVSKSHTNPDDLDHFVMVARTIPDDIKRFVSIIIANGKLLFKKQEVVKKTRPQKERLMARKLQMPAHNKTKVLQESVNKVEANTKDRKCQLPRQKAIEDNDYVHLQKKEDFEKMQSSGSQKQLEMKPQLSEKEPAVTSPDQDTLQKLESPKRIPLSEHCQLYFRALQKAIGVFKTSLNTNQPPEIFITHGKLIIKVGQKLVDQLCQEVKANESRNDILFKSSELCSLLKNLAMATKTAAIQYPNTAAMHELHSRTNELSDHTHLFRSMVE